MATDAAINATKAANAAIMAEHEALATLKRKGQEVEEVMKRLQQLPSGHDIIYWTQRTIWRNQQTMYRVNRLRPLRDFIPTDPPPTPDPFANILVCPPHCGNQTNMTNMTNATNATNATLDEDSEDDSKV